MKRLREKVISLLLVTFMVLPLMAGNVLAKDSNKARPTEDAPVAAEDGEDAEQPKGLPKLSEETFVDAETLKGYAMADGGTYALVKFGRSNWLTAGLDKETDGLVLLCDPLLPLTNKAFDSKGGVNYAASELHTYLAEQALSDTFSDGEKALIKKTKGTLLEEDLLYLANGVEKDTFFTLGAKDDIKITLSKESAFAGVQFYLRAAAASNDAVLVATDAGIASAKPDTVLPVMPAFCLDVTSVLFASAAPAATAPGSVFAGDPLQIRFDGTGKISSSAIFTKDSVTVEYASDDGALFLYVQGKDGESDFCFAQEITETATIDASSIRSGVDLSACKVWLEVKDEAGLAWAKMAEESKEVAVESVTVDPKTLSLKTTSPDNEGQLTATVLPEDASDKAVEWTSSDEKVATVDENGKVTAVGAGTATITVTTKSGGKTDTCEVTVVNDIASAKIDDVADQVYTGLEIKPEPKVTFNGKALVKGTDYELTYKDNLNVGTATITITGKGSYTGTATKTFKITPKQVTVTAKDQVKNQGQSDPTFTATVEGLVNKEPASLIKYSFIRETGEKGGTYKITPTGEALQGNYSVVFKAGTLTIKPLTYSFLKGAGSTWGKDSKVGLSFTVVRSYDNNVTYSQFTSVAIDGKTVAASNYTKASGSLVLTFKTTYLTTLANGEHTITVYFRDGSAQAKFTVAAKGSKSPDTGGTDVMLLLALLLGCASVAAMIVAAKKRPAEK